MTKLEDFIVEQKGDEKEFAVFIDYKEPTVSADKYDFNIYAFNFEKVKIVKINVEDYAADIEEIGITVLPCFIFLEDGKDAELIDLLDEEEGEEE